MKEKFLKRTYDLKNKKTKRKKKKKNCDRRMSKRKIDPPNISSTCRHKKPCSLCPSIQRKKVYFQFILNNVFFLKKMKNEK